jgi:hypothetical protein
MMKDKGFSCGEGPLMPLALLACIAVCWGNFLVKEQVPNLFLITKHLDRLPSLYPMLLQWVEEQRKGEEEHVLIHADVSTDNPLIVIATVRMLRWARQCGHIRPISMDCTFGITRYGYSLCTLIAFNERGRGVPVCVAIMRRERDVDFANILQTLRNKAGS